LLLRLITTLPLDPVRRAWGRACAASRPRIRGRRGIRSRCAALRRFRSPPPRKGRRFKSPTAKIAMLSCARLAPYRSGIGGDPQVGGMISVACAGGWDRRRFPPASHGLHRSDAHSRVEFV